MPTMPADSPFPDVAVCSTSCAGVAKGRFSERRRGLHASVKGGVLALLLIGLGGQAARAQSVGEEQQSRYGRASFYRYAQPDDITIHVNVWGAVSNSGIYEIPKDARLNTLLSAAGGPSLGVRERADEQTITITLVRKTEDGPQVVYKQVMEDEIEVTEENPALQNGDVLTVESYVVQGVNWRDVIGIGSSLASLILTAVSIATR